MNTFNNSLWRTPATTNILIANIVAYLAMQLLDIEQILGLFALFPTGSPFFEWWQPITYMFLHGDFTHLFFNMFALYMFGRQIEIDLGTKRFLIYYFACGVGAALVQLGIAQIDVANLADTPALLWDYLRTPTLGASGAVFGLLLAFGMLHPNATIMLIFPPIAMHAKWFVTLYGLLELLLIILQAPDGVAHFAHLGGMFWGWLLLMWWRRRDRNRVYYY
jgi:membrane associated rhomboid family serine protease